MSNTNKQPFSIPEDDEYSQDQQQEEEEQPQPNSRHQSSVSVPQKAVSSHSVMQKSQHESMHQAQQIKSYNESMHSAQPAAKSTVQYSEAAKSQIGFQTPNQANGSLYQAAGSLQYRVFHVTSQDSNFSISELSTAKRDSSQVRGWQSQRFCMYPQDIIVHFQQPVKLTQIQFLMHESFIPQSIQLSSYMPGSNNEIGMSGPLTAQSTLHLFQPIGQFQLDDNTGSMFQSRELKTVYLDTICQYFKLSLSKCFENNSNRFNQVSLIKMQFSGTYLGDYEINLIKPSDARSHPIQDPSVPHPRHGIQQDVAPELRPRNLKIQTIHESELDPQIISKLQVLQMKKNEAVHNEDFDLAMGLKEVYDSLKIMGSDLLMLQNNKIEAIECEDFEAAKAIKAEIARLNYICGRIDPHRPFDQNSNFEESLNEREMSKQYDQQVVENQEEDGMEELKFGQKRHDEDADQEIVQVIQSPSKYKTKYDDQAVPALALRQPIDFNLVTEDDPLGAGIGGSDKPDQNEELRYLDVPPTMKGFTDALLPYYGEPCCVRLFHRKWQFREEGVTIFIKEMNKAFQDAQESTMLHLNSAVVNALTEIQKDKVQQIITKSFDAVESYIKQMQLYSSVLTLKADQSLLERLLTYILDRLTNPQVAAKSQKLYLKFYECKQLDPNYLTSFLFKQHSYINKNNTTSTVHISQRLKIIEGVLEQRLGLDNFPTEIVFPAVRLCINASVADQRKCGLQCTVSLNKALGWKKTEFLVQKGYPQKILELLKADIPEVSQYIQKQ